MIECKYSVRFWWPPWSQDSFSAQTVLELICTSVDLFFSLSSNRVFVVETFTMLISQKQTLVSSDTSCAVGKRRDFFVRSHSVSSLFFFLISCYTFSANTDWAPQSTDQQRWRRSGSKNVFVMNDFTRTPLSTSTAPSKPSFQVVPLHKAGVPLTHTLCSRQLSSVLDVTETTRRTPIHAATFAVIYLWRSAARQLTVWQCSLSLTLEKLFQLLSWACCDGCLIISLRIISLSLYLSLFISLLLF